MSRIENIFFQVVKNENATTELFCNLMNYKVFRDKFLTLFLPHDLDKISFDDFSTQYSSDHGQPDIVIENDSFKILIEVKINTWTQLTSNQPLGYLNVLSGSSSQNKWLVFLIPKHYDHKAQIQNDINKFLASNASSSIGYKIIYWEDLVDVIEGNGLHKLNPFLAEFNSLLRAWYFTKDIYFEPLEVITMFSDQIPKHRKDLLQLKQIVDDIAGKNSSFSMELPSSRTFLPDEYGIYFKNSKDEYVLFFGIWFDFWEKKGKPLCFGVDVKKYPSSVVEAFRKRYAGKIEKYEGWEVSWFDEKTFLSPGTIDVINNELLLLLPALTS